MFYGRGRSDRPLLAPQISNVQCVVVVVVVVCLPQPVMAAITTIESRIVWRMPPAEAPGAVTELWPHESPSASPPVPF